MKVIHCLLFLLIGICAALATVTLWEKQNYSPSSSQKQTAFDRVMRTGTLRCAYLVYPPETIKDPVTGKLSGIVIETTEELVRQLGWKVDWVAEVGFQDMFEGLTTDRYDALCGGLYEKPNRAKVALFSAPFNYGVTYTVARADDVRFDKSLEPINDPSIKIAQLDGEISQAIAEESFSKAGRYSLSNLSDVSQMAEAVATEKADVTFMTIANARSYMEGNPGKLKLIHKLPSRVYPAPLLALAHGEQELKYVIDATIRTLQENHFIERTVRKYDPKLETYLLAKPSYDLNVNP